MGRKKWMCQGRGVRLPGREEGKRRKGYGLEGREGRRRKKGEEGHVARKGEGNRKEGLRLGREGKGRGRRNKGK